MTPTPTGEALAASVLAALPRRIGNYEILTSIASGGMATVFLARQHGVGGFRRDVALKTMHAHLREEPQWCSEFLEEAKLAATIRHPNVVSVLDVGEDAAATYLVMDYVEGDTLAGLTRVLREARERMPRPIALRILSDALAGLHAAHELRNEKGSPVGLVHRDFSPQNVLVGTDGVGRLTDFGIAKASNRKTYTRTGTIKGKVRYMAPEQIRGESLDRRCDLWAAGVVAWELVTGCRLYEGEDVSVGIKIISGRPPRARSVDPSIPEGIDRAIASALTPDPDERCATAEELIHLLAEGEPLADRSDVATFVSDLVGPKLAERRARAVEALRARADVPPVSGVQILAPSQPPLAQLGATDRELLPWDKTVVSPDGVTARPSARRTTALVLAAVLGAASIGGAVITRVRLSAPSPSGTASAPGPVEPPPAAASVLPLQDPGAVLSPTATASAPRAAPATKPARRRFDPVPRTTASSPRERLAPDPYKDG